jgi:hypothetical protein
VTVCDILVPLLISTGYGIRSGVEYVL